MFEHAAKLAAAGDLAGARAMSDAAAKLLGETSTATNVVDLTTKLQGKRR